LFQFGCEGTSTEDVATGTVISTGFAASLDAVAAKVIGPTALEFGAPITNVELDSNRGTITAICHHKWYPSVGNKSRVVVSPIEGSEYWIVSKHFNADPNAKFAPRQVAASSELIPLPRNMLGGYGKVIKRKGFASNYVKSGDFFDRSQYKSPRYSGPLDYCIRCANERNYLLSQFPNNSFSVAPCPDHMCKNCSSRTSQQPGNPRRESANKCYECAVACADGYQQEYIDRGPGHLGDQFYFRSSTAGNAERNARAQAVPVSCNTALATISCKEVEVIQCTRHEELTKALRNVFGRPR
jgi:hypothetical protein